MSPRRRLKPWRDGLSQLLSMTARGAVTSMSRLLQRVGGMGRHGARIRDNERPTVLLFFEDVEDDRFVPGDRHLRRLGRRAYHAITEGRRVSGFEIAFRLLCRALEREGCRVVVNNARLARRHPTHPVGLCGYPHLLGRWRLTNPAILGPGLLDHPAQAPQLMDDPRFRRYLVPSEWMRQLFAEHYGEAKCGVWFGGVDVDEWPDLSGHPKDVDLLIYEKFLWQREQDEPRVLAPILAETARRGLRVEVLRYGKYDQAHYAALLARCRGMVFLCEHETQGLAYQEAMARNVPILAWDQGSWLDPIRLDFSRAPIRASSVPYFAPECGETFTGPEGFPAALDRFLARLPTYAPRRYVAEHLSMKQSAQRYLEAYQAARDGR